MNAATAKAPIPMFTEHNAVRGDLREDGARFVGWTPGGSEWWAYSEDEFGPLCERLDTMLAKTRKVRRVKLTSAQFDIIEDVIASREDDHDFRSWFKLRKTYIEGTNEQFEDIATFIDPEDIATFAESGAVGATTDAACAFVWRSAYVSALMLKSNLQGLPTTLAGARRIAKRLRSF